MENKKSFNDYIKIIKEEKESESNEKTSDEIKKEALKEKNKQVLDKIKSEKPKKIKKFVCPIETSDISLNLKNRQKAIDEFGYGPLNPVEENKNFWDEKVKKWRLDSLEEAKKSLCGNCSAFIITKDMLNCIEKGLTADDKNVENAWNTIEAGQLGYCEALDFKCSALRTCDAWIVGGPISDKKVKKE